MKNTQLVISPNWEIKRDEFYEIDPHDKSLNDEFKFNNLFCQENLLFLEKTEYKLDLGWYGEGISGHFGLYLYKGNDWNNCHLLEKRITNNYQLIIDTINAFIKNVDLELYGSIKTKLASIDDYDNYDTISVLIK